jgi:hypothetical protein
VPYLDGPDVPTTGEAIVVTAFEDEYWVQTEGPRTHEVLLPAGHHDRVILEFSGGPAVDPECVPDDSADCSVDPYDRLFGVAVAGVEMLRGTTPRARFTVFKDITEYRPVLPAGGTVEVTLTLGSYNLPGNKGAAHVGSVRLHFYADEPYEPGAFDEVDPVFLFHRFEGDGASRSDTMTFAQEPPREGIVELTMSGHGGQLGCGGPCEEFWYTDAEPGPRIFHVLIDGTEVATAVMMPYVYAFVGFAGSFGTTTHPIMWWTAQQATDRAGVYTGSDPLVPSADRARAPAAADRRAHDRSQAGERLAGVDLQRERLAEILSA